VGGRLWGSGRGGGGRARLGPERPWPELAAEGGGYLELATACGTGRDEGGHRRR
jgi:hypothetical protein